MPIAHGCAFFFRDGAHALEPIDHYLCACGDVEGVVKRTLT
jgi:hypothetical protein